MKLAQMETILGNEKTIGSLVTDILDHYENYRAELLTGKAMIVAYSRAIALKIYKKILSLCPTWKEKLALVMTESNNDPEDWRQYDVLSLATMYIYKPMSGHKPMGF